MTLRNQTFRPLFTFFSSVTFLTCLWLVGCTPAPDNKSGDDGDKPAANAEEEGEAPVDAEQGKGDDSKAGTEEEAPADPGPKVDPAKDDVKAGEPTFPDLPE